MKSKSKTFNRRQFVYGAGAMMSLPIVGCGKSEVAGNPPPKATGKTVTIFENGVVLPVDAAFSEYEAIAIADNRVLAVGGRELVRRAAGDSAQIVDLDGRVMLPGFIEPHMHFALLAGLGH